MGRQVTDEDVHAVLADRKVVEFMAVFKNRYRHQLDEDECESTANYALLKALQAWDAEKSKGGKFSTYLFTTLGWEFNRRAENELRFQQGRVSSDFRRMPSRPAADPDDDFGGDVAEYIGRYLSKKQAEAFRQYHIEGRSSREIGDNLDLTECQVRRQVRAAERRLRDVID